MAASSAASACSARKTLKLMASNHLPGGVDLPAMSRSMFAEAAY